MVKLLLLNVKQAVVVISTNPQATKGKKALKLFLICVPQFRQSKNKFSVL